MVEKEDSVIPGTGECNPMDSLKVSEDVISKPGHDAPTVDEVSGMLDSFSKSDQHSAHDRFMIWRIEEFIPFIDYETAKRHGLVGENYPVKLFESIFQKPERRRVIDSLITPNLVRYGYSRIASGKLLACHRTINQLIALTWLAGDRQLSNDIEMAYQSTFDSINLGKHILDMVANHYGLDMDTVIEMSSKYGRPEMDEAR